MKVADYIAAYLAQRGVTHVYELVGGMITFLLDAIARQEGITIVSVHHEQAAAFAAEGHGRMQCVPGVALATSGPGATNLLTGIGSCYFDSTAAVFITGQVNRHEMKRERAIRQLGFQETDIVSVARPITKLAVQVENPQDIPQMIGEAFRVALSGRPGPVLLDIPMDVQRADIDAPPMPLGGPAGEERFDDDPKPALFLHSVQEGFAAAEKPLILAGGGIRSGRTTTEFRQYVHLAKVPVVNSLMGVDLLPSMDPYRVGMIGSYGNRWANLALSECDFLLVLGSRLDVRQTGADTKSFEGHKTICHVDCDPGELNNRVTGCHTLVSSLADFFRIAGNSEHAFPAHPDWLAHIRDLRAAWPDTSELKLPNGINPNEFLHHLSSVSARAAAYVADVGQHQMWAAQSLELLGHQRFLTSGGMGSMGFALPAGIGASFASHRQPVVVIAGDGGFQCNIQELQTVARNRLPLKIVILNNQCHGMVRQFQESYFHGRYQSTVWGYDTPAFHEVASAYGIDSCFVDKNEDVESALARMWKHPDLPFLLEVAIPQDANAYPKLAFGRPISDMEPLARPLDMEGT